MTALAEAEPVNPAALAYINRLSDYCSCRPHRQCEGKADVIWVPGANR